MIFPAIAFDAFTPADWVDLGCGALLLIGILQGAFRGFSGELSRLAGVLAALTAALWLRRPLGEWLAAHTRLEPTPGQAPLVVYLVVFVLALILAFLARRLLGRFVRLVVTPTTDVLLGIVAGGVRMAVFMLALGIAWTWFPDSDLRGLVLGHSRAGRTLAPLVDIVNRRIIDAPAIAEPLREWSGKDTPAPASAGAPHADDDVLPEPVE